MKSNILLAGFLGGTLALGVSETTTPCTPIPPSNPLVSLAAAPALITQFTGVRAEFTTGATGGTGPTDTELVLTNMHLTKGIRVKDVIVLGRHGLHTTLTIYRGLSGGLIPPLGQVVLSINGTIGVKAGNPNVRSPRDVASAVVGWDGPIDALKLTSVIKQKWFTGNTAFLGVSTAEGYKVKTN